MGMQNFLKKLFGSRSDREIRVLHTIVDEINSIYGTLQDKSDEDLIRRTGEFRNELKDLITKLDGEFDGSNLDSAEIRKQKQKRIQEKLNEILPEAFAMVKDMCRRLMGQKWRVTGQEITWEMIPYDVQLIGAIILNQGKVAEMKTGEGKTLVATLPIYLNALTGQGVHIITVNDYLAQRDAEWMGEVFKQLGLTVGFILNTMSKDERREAYNCDITYGTNNEFGFDYLRDNMSLTPEEQVQRGHNYAVVDEVDSVLIDEARTPLIISGAVDSPVDRTSIEMKPAIQRLVRKQTSLVSELVREAEQLLGKEDQDQAGLKLLQARRGMPKNRTLMKMFQEPRMQKLVHSVESVYIRDKKMHEVDEDLFYSVDEKTHVIDLTDKGRSALAPESPETFVIPDLGTLLHDVDTRDDLSDLEKNQEKEKVHQLYTERSAKIHTINQLLRAFTLYEKDVEYVVQGGKVLIVDEFTGRILPGRRYSDGLHQALEAKENVTIERETQTLATITIQNYFRLYAKLSGMTGTAETEEEELGSIYNLDVIVIPTNVSVVRNDNNDLIYKTKREKYKAVIDEISRSYHEGQPVLVGTISVEVSELISRMLKRQKIPHNVLNAKQHQSEAEIVLRAGQRGSVTIATNMAGRGTDIKLGEGVKELGGLKIIGTERHESRRIDLQLRGRAGRQGDPGESVFFLSLEDDLMRLFNSERIASIMDRMGVEEGEVITHKMVTRAIQNAQKKVEGRNFGIRKHLLEYDDVMNQQRQVIYDLRNQALHGTEIQETVKDILDDYLEEEIQDLVSTDPSQWDWDAVKQRFASHLLVDISPEKLHESSGNGEITSETLRTFLTGQADEIYRARESLVPEEIMRNFERFVVLRTIDEIWKDHLYAMDQIREGINLRAYGQKNPLLEYKSEGFNLFQSMISDMNKKITQRLFRTQIRGVEQPPGLVQQARNIRTEHQDSTGLGLTPTQQQASQPSGAPNVPVHSDEKIGRNEKIKVVSPSGKQIEIKYKKLQQYLNQGYSRVS